MIASFVERMLQVITPTWKKAKKTEIYSVIASHHANLEISKFASDLMPEPRSYFKFRTVLQTKEYSFENIKKQFANFS
jgi:hypothetical protein